MFAIEELTNLDTLSFMSCEPTNWDDPGCSPYSTDCEPDE